MTVFYVSTLISWVRVEWLVMVYVYFERSYHGRWCHHVALLKKWFLTNLRMALGGANLSQRCLYTILGAMVGLYPWCFLFSNVPFLLPYRMDQAAERRRLVRRAAFVVVVLAAWMYAHFCWRQDLAGLVDGPGSAIGPEDAVQGRHGVFVLCMGQ